MAKHVTDSGLGLVRRCCTLAAEADMAPAALLLSKSFLLGNIQFPPALGEVLHSLVRSYSTPRVKQHRKQRSKHHQDTQRRSTVQQHAENDDDAAFWSVASSPNALNLSARRSSQQHTRHARNQTSPHFDKHRHSSHHQAANTSPSLRGADAAAAAAAAQQQWPNSNFPSASQHSSKQHHQPLPELPTALGVWSSNSSSDKSVSAVPSASDISESQLMALLHRARTLGDMEQILLKYHANFR